MASILENFKQILKRGEPFACQQRQTLFANTTLRLNGCTAWRKRQHDKIWLKSISLWKWLEHVLRANEIDSQSKLASSVCNLFPQLTAASSVFSLAVALESVQIKSERKSFCLLNSISIKTQLKRLYPDLSGYQRQRRKPQEPQERS